MRSSPGRPWDGNQGTWPREEMPPSLSLRARNVDWNKSQLCWSLSGLLRQVKRHVALLYSTVLKRSHLAQVPKTPKKGDTVWVPP